MSEFVRDVRFAVRSLARTPAFTALGVLTLALGIGATTAVFSMVNGLVLGRLPYENDRRILHVEQPSSRRPDEGFSVREVATYRERLAGIATVSEYHSMAFQIYGEGEPQRVLTGVVSDNFFSMLGVRPVLGRLFTPGEEAVGAPNVLVLGYRYWQEQYGGDPHIVGKRFTMNDRIATVIGVLPPLPAYPDDNDIWMPAGACPFRSAPNMMAPLDMRMVTMYASMRAGMDAGAGVATLATVSRALHTEHPEAYPERTKLGFEARTVREELTRPARPLSLTLLASALFVLLVATANFASLTLARQLRRSREMALRAALGAGRRRLFRQLATESLVVTLTGGLLGVLLAYGGLGLLRMLGERVSARANEISIDATVLAVATVASVLTGLAAALAPLVRRRVDLAAELRASSAATTGTRSDSRIRAVLVAAQVAVAFVVLVGAGLLVRSLTELQRVDGGYDVRNVLTARVDLNWSRYRTNQQVLAFADRLMARLSAQPGVSSVALASDFPLNVAQPSTIPFTIRGRASDDDQPPPRSDATVVSPEYFKSVGIPLLRGRAFAASDRDSSAAVAIIGRRLAATFWPDADPLGAEVSIDRGEHWLRVIGVVGDVRQNGPAQAESDEIYIPFARNPSSDMRVLIRTNGTPESFAPALKTAVAELDPLQPVVAIQSLEELRGARLAEPRVTTVLMTAFALVALLITAGGLAGVVAHAVSRRVNEIGIRVALGASSREVLWLVLRGSATVILVGLAIGAVAATALSRVIAGLLFTVSPRDPLTFGAVGSLLVMVAAIACLLPARRATRVDPAEALRVR